MTPKAITNNTLFYGDNLPILREHIADESVDLVYLDPSQKGMHWKFTIDRLDELDQEGRIYWPSKGTMPQYKRYREELKGKAVADI